MCRLSRPSRGEVRPAASPQKSLHQPGCRVWLASLGRGYVFRMSIRTFLTADRYPVPSASVRVPTVVGAARANCPLQFKGGCMFSPDEFPLSCYLPHTLFSPMCSVMPARGGGGGGGGGAWKMAAFVQTGPTSNSRNPTLAQPVAEPVDRKVLPLSVCASCVTVCECTHLVYHKYPPASVGTSIQSNGNTHAQWVGGRGFEPQCG